LEGSCATISSVSPIIYIAFGVGIAGMITAYTERVVGNQRWRLLP
jgi:hypothetical protein